MKRLNLFTQDLDLKLPSLIILVGESGAGKSTLCRLINRPDLWYSSSGEIVKELQKRGITPTHDSIHEFANQAYAESPLWQVDRILENMKNAGCLMLDGPRRIREVEALKDESPNVFIFRVVAPESERFKRLHQRDGINEEDFNRVLYDESNETGLGQILNMADFIIENDGSIEKLESEAQNIHDFVSRIEASKESKSEIDCKNIYIN
jgi:dephospho-CoA kinase